MPANPLERLALALILAGLCAFVVLDLAGQDQPTPAQGYEITGGTAYPVDPAQSKAFRANLERHQGKSGLMLYELGRWWDGLWKGRALGRTLLVMSALSAGGLVLWARFFPPLDAPEDPAKSEDPAAK